jgi:hypothetical protein
MIGSEVEAIVREIQTAGYVFIRAGRTREALAASGAMPDWPDFAASWNTLETDTYLAESGRFRKRRYAVYELGAGGAIARLPHQPHRQQVEYNPLFGDVDRWFAPIEPATGDAASMQTILKFCAGVFLPLSHGAGRWHIEVHQFRIEALPDVHGHPTPEGVHRDGVDFVLVLLITRRNIASGTTTVHSLTGVELGSFTLTDPFDAALLDDARVAHGVTPVTPLDPAQPAYRDVLVVTFRRLG